VRALLLVGLLGLQWVGMPTWVQVLASDDIVVYSGRKESAIKPVVKAFEKETGITVRLKVGKTSGLANELLQEKARPRSDVFISTESGIMEILAQHDILESYLSPAAEGLEPGLKDNSGRWTGISSRIRVILYNTKLVADNEKPRSVFQLTDPRWKGKIVIAGTRERTTLSWVSSLIASKGEPFTRDFLTRLYKNGLNIVPDNTDVWQGVGRGEFTVGLTNSPNYFLARKEGYPVGIVYPDQEEGGLGTMLNLNAIALVKGAPNEEPAKRFIDFTLSPEGQRLLIDGAYEIPLKPDTIDQSPLAGFRRTPVTEKKLAQLANTALTILRDIGPEW
jgi:iron(III) transport system substrate-binding protein